MHREARFRTWKPKLKCSECKHVVDVHNIGGLRGSCSCGCKKFSFKKWPKKVYAKGQDFKGIKYDSGLEARVSADLNQQLSCGELTDLCRQYPVDIILNGIKILRYYVDFRVIHNDGVEEFIEVKGVWDELSKIKRNLFEAVYLSKNPSVLYRVLR